MGNDHIVAPPTAPIASLTSSIYQSTSHFTLALHTIKSLQNSISSHYTDPFKRTTRGPLSTGPSCDSKTSFTISRRPPQEGGRPGARQTQQWWGNGP
eukprot:COSAG02_NODE_4324_length_5500_cov_4.544714_6_plen_97_part_00